MSTHNFRFTHYDLREQRAGTIVDVTLNAVNNVRLMTAVNFQRFKEKLDYKYVGGIAKKSPTRVIIPDAGHWHLIVDEEGHGGLAGSSVKVVAPPGRQTKAS
ncbi:DUF1883 domain-containing protein [Neorhizobium sp. JUb45]|uniref:DUF1883 domain-containing protein n=1 Tax=unclassified Neorhizobium TaxID=2629175 RepID=UPI001051C339|nr:DUF1883 domain-containing protein [Neorhizobium sp. JUb45]TCR04734.1 uncharacterized protein DUF1883 [Neorhizobium sp. JUb45]